MAFVYLNGALIARVQALIPVADRGFRFGDGVFETVPVYAGKPYQWAFHRLRLQKGLARLRIAYDIAPLEEALGELIAGNGLRDGFVRIAVSRGSGSAGYLPLSEAVPTVVMETLERQPPFQRPATLWLSAIEKVSPAALPTDIKTAQGLNAVLARMEAQEHDCDDALMHSGRGMLAETSSANIFWLSASTLHTPPLSTGALNGSARHAVMRLSPWPVQETEAPLEALRGAEAVFITNCNVRVRGVTRLEPLGWEWNSGEAAAKLLRLMEEDILAGN